MMLLLSSNSTAPLYYSSELPPQTSTPSLNWNVNRRRSRQHSSCRLSSRPEVISATPNETLRSITSNRDRGATSAINVPSFSLSSGFIGKDDQETVQEFQMLSTISTEYNNITILDSPRSRLLLLDDTQNIHSILYKGQKWTDSYWDELASLPAIIPQGPIAIFGLGGGTVAHLILNTWPSLQLEGWELDEILIDKAREYFGVSDLENYTDAGGVLRVHIGDALSSSTKIPGGYAGIIVDLFSDGKVLPQLEEAETWLQLSEKLMVSGRIMVNCGGSSKGESDEVYGTSQSETSSIDGSWAQNSTMKALYDAFGGQLNWKKMPDGRGPNYLAVTGPLPDLTLWSVAVPSHLSSAVKLWRPCEILL
ncbi:hypothetical protein Nepgr_030623 [Nepenthes gracilis]|uniref:S-adenosyl-L-methionine-dependent methyltransferases superfamily protein n=1 Tax=Nepenthes gracilis TaxID=150966 RepID=A0AAD3TFN3_NEPGR|nr:hypothetical protein Nepgr_030623 [Nepenthes gracilis]